MEDRQDCSAPHAAATTRWGWGYVWGQRCCGRYNGRLQPPRPARRRRCPPTSSCLKWESRSPKARSSVGSGRSATPLTATSRCSRFLRTRWMRRSIRPLQVSSRRFGLTKVRPSRWTRSWRSSGKPRALRRCPRLHRFVALTPAPSVSPWLLPWKYPAPRAAWRRSVRPTAASVSHRSCAASRVSTASTSHRLSERGRADG